jgi:hypothetical protein
MANHPRMSKAFFDDAAGLAGSPEAARIGKLLQILEPGTGEPPLLVGAAPGPGEGAPSSGPEPIAGWLPQQVDGQLLFVQPEGVRLLDPYGTRQRVWTARKDPRHLRVCYLGESVATGLHYAPDYSFGKIMAAQLDAAVGPGVFDFVDLSMAGILRHTLVEQFRASFQLNPDVIIIMAGNNWRAMMPRDPLAEAQALREGGYRGLLAYRLDSIRSAAEETMRSLAELAKGRNTRVIIVVPENNMRDFTASHPVAWLPGDGSPRWHVLHQSARERLEARAYEPLAEIAREMVELDGGTCSTSHRLRALALAGLGRTEEARAAFYEEMTCVVGNRWIVEIPRTGPVIQDAMRQGARADGFSCVDTPALLRDDAATTLPGRESFYDYCHFTVELMRKVAATVVLEVLRATRKDPAPGVTVESLCKAAPELLATTDAAAKLGATLANAMISHELREVAEHWCEQAVKASGGILQNMVDQLDMQTGPTPAILTQSYQRLSQSPYKKTFWEFPGGITLEAMCKVASHADPGVHARILEILQQNLGLNERPLDLSQHLHALSWNERFMDDFEWGQRGDDRLPFNRGPLYRAPWPTSTFFAIHDGRRDVHLELVGRLPAVGGKRSGMVAVSVNGKPVGEVAVGSGWSKHSLRVPARVWQAGPNRVSLHWPALPPAGEEALKDVVARWEQGAPALPFPVFGELFCLSAQAAQASS